MGEAPIELAVQDTVTEIEVAVAELGESERPKHQRSSSVPSAMPSSSDSDSDVEGTQSNEETRNYSPITSSARRAGIDATSESSSSDYEITTGRQSSRVSFNKPTVVPARSCSTLDSLEGKSSSAAGGNMTKSSSMTTFTATVLKSSSGKSNSKVTHRFPSRKKKKAVPKTTRSRGAEQDSDEEEVRKRKKKRHSPPSNKKTMQRSKRAKDYDTSDSDSEDEDAHKVQQVPARNPIPQPTVEGTTPVNKSMELHSPRKHEEIAKNDENSSSESDVSTTSNDSDDEDEDEEEARRKTHSRKSSIHGSPPHDNSRGRAGAESDPFTQHERSHHESRHSHPQDNADEDRDEQSDDDRKIRRKQKKSASFSEASAIGSRAVTRIQTRISYSFSNRRSKVVVVRNLVPNVNQRLLQEFFSGCGTVTDVNIFKDQFGQCSGSAYIEFDSGEAARKAQQKTGHKFLGRVVQCEVVHEMNTSGHVDPPKSETKNPKFSSTKPKTGPTVATGVRIDIQSILKVFTRGGDTSSEDQSVRNPSHKKSKSTDSLHSPLKRDTVTAFSGNEQSVHDPNATAESFRGFQTAGATSRGSKKRLFGLSRSKSSGSRRKGSGSGSSSGKLGKSYSQSRHAPSQDPEPEGQQPQLESGETAEAESKGIEAKECDCHSRSIEVQSGAQPEVESRDILDRELQTSKDQRKWGQKHPWMKKMLFWQHLKTPRWHSCHSANSVEIRIAHSSIKKSPSLDLRAEPPEGYPLGYPHFASSSMRRLKVMTSERSS
ncbi:hypothetical protein R1sor_019103 [Riccia sorocarpa]|uniref:RRM domain-containing protein n=1 Tax=Riccia sorocarpa TaxID=122646 RepID=A0ABD3IFP6_9MARC